MRRVIAPAAVAAVSLLVAGCSGGNGEKRASAAPAPPRACPAAWLPGWQKLANRIGAAVYCPTWLPDPLTGEIGGRWNNLDSVDPDRSYLEGFVWQETGPGAAGGELHVNLRGYPGTTRIPICEDTVTDAEGHTTHPKLPCFSEPNGKKQINGITATVYTVNQGADQWHVLYAWRYQGGLYTLSEHVARPLTFKKVVRYLDRMLAGLVLVEPKS